MYRVLSGRHLGNAFQQLCTSAIFLHHLPVGQRDIRIGEGRTGQDTKENASFGDRASHGKSCTQDSTLNRMAKFETCTWHFGAPTLLLILVFFFSDVRRVLWVRHHEACPFSFFLYSFLCLSCTTAE